MRCKIFPLGDNALTVEFGNEISIELNTRVLRLADYFREHSFAGLIETVPAYASLSVFYDVPVVRKNYSRFSTAFDAIKNLVENALSNLNDFQALQSRVIKIPICFDKEFAFDLASLASKKNLTEKEVVKIFLEKTYCVYMLGFLPGFSYMGEVDERIAAPRKQTPRLEVPKGSVGIAGRQTGIYSLDSPGGWQIIGKTNIELFTPKSEIPTFLQAGDSVKFYESNLNFSK